MSAWEGSKQQELAEASRSAVKRCPPNGHAECVSVSTCMGTGKCAREAENQRMVPRREPTPAATAPDMIHHPAHYTQGIECWDYVTSHKLGFLEGNVIKYVTRYRHKGGLTDLLKARQYLERLIKELGGTPNTEF